jgi:2'-5' RNA ligase
MRLFVAIDLGENVMGNIISAEERLGSGDFDLKLVEPENLHLTLKFLGDVQESQKEQIERLISEAVKGVHAFMLSFEGVGYFGSARQMKVIWAGVKEGSRDFVNLAKALDSRLSFIRREDHEPSPHLTIARVRSGRNGDMLLREVNSLRDVNMGEVPVKEIRLKQSVLTPQGPIYSDVKVFPLISQKEGVSRRLHSGE